MKVNRLSLLIIIKPPYNYQNIILWCIFFYHIPILPYMMVNLIEIAVKNRLKWIVILLLYHEIIFMFLHFVWLNSQCSPFLFLSQCSWCMPPASLQCSWGCMPPPTPFNDALEDTCLPLPFNALEDACLPRLPSMLLRMHCLPLPPAFKALDAWLPPPLPSTLILKLVWLLAPENPIPFWSDSKFACATPFLFIHFDFLIILTMRSNYSLISHVFYISTLHSHFSMLYLPEIDELFA